MLFEHICESDALRKLLSPLQMPSAVMISPALNRSARKAVLQKCYSKPMHCRRLTTAPSRTLSYETSEAAGVKIASRDIAGPTTYLALVAKAGTRYQCWPGLTEALEKFAFKVGLQWNQSAFALEALTRSLSKYPLLIWGNTEHKKTFSPSNHKGNRTIRGSAHCVSLAGKSGHWRQVFTGRPPIYCGVARRDYFTNKIHAYIHLSRHGGLKLISCQVMSIKKKLPRLSNFHKKHCLPMWESSPLTLRTALHFTVGLAFLYIQHLLHRFTYTSIMIRSRLLANRRTQSRILLSSPVAFLMTSSQNGFTNSSGILRAVHP